MIQDFPNGLLWMSREPLDPVPIEASWTHDPVHSVLAIFTIVLLIIFMRDFFILAGPVSRCLVRGKANVELEHSVQLARTRNRAALLALLPMWLAAERFSLVSESMWITLAIVTGYLFLRGFFSAVLPSGRLPSESRLAVRRALYTYSIVLSALMTVTVGIWALARWDIGTMRYVLAAEAGVILMLSFGREAQILNTVFRPFITFLYLCGLEILPAAGLVAASILVK